MQTDSPTLHQGPLPLAPAGAKVEDFHFTDALPIGPRREVVKAL